MNPAQLPQTKNGEHPAHAFSGIDFPAVLTVTNSMQSLSAQHGRTDNRTTQKDNSKQMNFTRQIYTNKILN
jgi:hypothetical protein